MKFLLLAILLMFGQICFAQTLIDEYELTNSDSESARIDNFLTYLQNESESKGLIVIYSGKNQQELGIVLRHIEGIKQYVNLRSGESVKERISFKINEEDKAFTKELWIYPKEILLPEIKEVSFNLDNLKTKFLYATTCEDCDPAVPLLSANFPNLKLYAELLEKYPDYKGSIIIYPASFGLSKKIAYETALGYAAQYRNLLTKEYKISNKRISIVIAKNVSKESPTTAKLFIVPRNAK